MVNVLCLYVDRNWTFIQRGNSMQFGIIKYDYIKFI